MLLGGFFAVSVLAGLPRKQAACFHSSWCQVTDMGVCCIDGFQRSTLTVPLGEMPAAQHFVLGRKPGFVLCETGLLGV